MQRFEGLRLHALALPDGGFVIGHGHLSAADPGREITAAEAHALLLFDLSRLAAEIEPLVLAPTTPAQFDALLSFAFGVGTEAFARSTVLKRLNAGAYLDAAAALELWRCARIADEAQVIDVLVRRRAVEKARFLEPPEGFAPAPSALLRPQEDVAVLALAERLDDGRRTYRFAAAEGADEPAPSAALAVVAALSTRLDRLMRAEPASDRTEPEPEPEPEPPPLVVAPPPVAPLPVSADDREDAPSLLAAEDDAPAATPVQAEVAQPQPQPPPPRRTDAFPAPPEPRVSLPSLRGPAFVLGFLGLLLFAFAVLKTYQAPSLAWLGLGLLAVAAMVPASLFLIGPRKRDDD